MNQCMLRFSLLSLACAIKELRIPSRNVRLVLSEATRVALARASSPHFNLSIRSRRYNNNIIMKVIKYSHVFTLFT